MTPPRAPPPSDSDERPSQVHPRRGLPPHRPRARPPRRPRSRSSSATPCPTSRSRASPTTPSPTMAASSASPWPTRPWGLGSLPGTHRTARRLTPTPWWCSTSLTLVSTSARRRSSCEVPLHPAATPILVRLVVAVLAMDDATVPYSPLSPT